MKRTATLLLVGVLLVGIGAPVWAARVACDDESPVRDKTTFIRLTDVDDPTAWKLSVTYHPNSVTAKTDELGVFDVAGKATWKPAVSSIVEIVAKGPGKKDKAVMNIAVRFPSPPISGIVILLLAGTILFGGAGYSLFKAIKE